VIREVRPVETSLEQVFLETVEHGREAKP